MKQYLDILRDILDNGTVKTDRTGVGTKSIFGTQSRYDLSEGFPLLTTKKVFTRGIIEELLWFLSGDTNKKTLQEKNVHIWDAWGDDETGELGPVYGHQWRAWDDYSGGHIDQIANAVEMIKNNPVSWSMPGMSPRWTGWPFLHATVSSSSMWRTASFPASSTREAPTYSLACLSTSLPMPC